jgi:putative membrane protein
MEVSARLPALLAAMVITVLLLSGWAPYDRGTWVLETAPVFIALAVLFITRERFPLTPLLYALIAAHAFVLIYGGTHTYARVPLGYWLQDAFDLMRNPYDRIGHFMQGFVPAIVAREILIRRAVVSGATWRSFLIVCICLAISASYEFLEWWAALALGQGADAFLGTQGDPWDTQWDMFMATLGAISALVALGTLHDRQLCRFLKSPAVDAGAAVAISDH